jgi:hypothetical protein
MCFGPNTAGPHILVKKKEAPQLGNLHIQPLDVG